MVRPLICLLGILLAAALSACDKPASNEAKPPTESSTPEQAETEETPRPLPSPTSEPAPSPSPSPTPPPEPTPEPVPEPVPNSYIPYKQMEVAKLFNEIQLKTSVETTQGDIPSVERQDPNAFEIEIKIRLRIPEAASALDELAAVNPELPQILPGLDTMMEEASVSGYYHQLYKNKSQFLHSRTHRLERIISVHNYYDTQTILELKSPDTGRRVLLIQADMDVVTDGSDGDRYGEIEVISSSFQPFTSYAWPKQTDQPNPFLEEWETKLQELEDEFAIKGLSIQRNRELRAGIEKYKRGVWSLKNRSFLIAETDPFVVLPGMMYRSGNNAEYQPSLGDYAAVIYKDTIYPAIVGDAGPSYKSGEASLRICREIEPRSSGIRRAVSNLGVTYLVFPGTAEKPFGPPDLDHWQEKVETYLNEIGGYNATLRNWEDLTKPPPTPTPSPSPTPSPNASPTPESAA